MNPTNDSVEFFNPSFGQALPATDNAATGSQPDIGAVWEDLGILALAVQGPIVEGGGLPQFQFPALADVPATVQVTQRRNSETGRMRSVCHVCSREFTRPSLLRIHMRSHIGERPYECLHPGCYKRFSARSNLRRHAKLHVDWALRRGPRPQYTMVDMRTGRILGYRRNLDPLH